MSNLDQDVCPVTSGKHNLLHGAEIIICRKCLKQFPKDGNEKA